MRSPEPASEALRVADPLHATAAPSATMLSAAARPPAAESPSAAEAPAAETPAPPSRRRRWAVNAAKLVLLALALWLTWRLLAGLAWEDLAARMEAARRPWLAAALVALTVRFVIWDQRWRRAILRVGPLPPRRLSFASLLSAAAVNTVTPTARLLGGVMRARHLAKAVGQPMGRAYGSVLFDQLAHQVVIGGITWLSLIAAAAVTGKANLAVALTAGLALTAAAFALWLRRRRNGNGGEGTLVRWLAERVAGRDADEAGALTGHRQAEGEAAGEAAGGRIASGEAAGGEPGRLTRLVAHGREAVGVVRRLLADRRLRVEVVLLGLAFFLVNASAQWMVFEALGADVSFVVVLAVVALGAMAGVAVGTPGGLGGAEAAMIASFTAFGVAPLDAAAGALLYRAIHFVVILGLGAPSLVWLEMRLGRRPDSQHRLDSHHRPDAGREDPSSNE